ncbi:hypothetical protein TgHK011_000620 [Trichoderma gracile]|nr:hypothetical protein TgHK011_000620 [Trichoderma gracile]
MLTWILQLGLTSGPLHNDDQDYTCQRVMQMLARSSSWCGVASTGGSFREEFVSPDARVLERRQWDGSGDVARPNRGSSEVAAPF